MTDPGHRPAYVSVAPTRRGVRGRLLNAFLRAYIKPRARSMDASNASIAEMRRRLEALGRYGVRRTPGIAIGQTQIAGVACEIVEPEAADGDRPALLYVHGGGFIMGSSRTHRGITQFLARAMDARVVVPNYRLAPEHPFPQPLDDVVDVYRTLLESFAARRIAIAGDSAGGNLVFSTLIEAKNRALPMPAAAMAMSPWTDLTCSGASVGTLRKKDAMLPAERLAAAASLYLAGGPADAPAASPLFGDLAGLPPFLVHVGTTEILMDDSTRIVDRARAAGVDARLRLWHTLPHVFHAFCDYLPAGRDALLEVSNFLAGQLART